MKHKPTLGKLEQTERGFNIVRFSDHYGLKCSLQESSLSIDGGAIWLGLNDTEPKVMASKAAEVGVSTTETCGWVPYPIPKEVLISGRMHLTRDQVKALMTHLQNWLDNNDF